MKRTDCEGLQGPGQEFGMWPPTAGATESYKQGSDMIFF